MSVTAHFPAALQSIAGHTIVVTEPVTNVGELLRALESLAPGISAELDDPLYNIAVNDEILLHKVEQHPVADGDVVEIVPTLAGG